MENNSVMKSNYPGIFNEKILLIDVSNYVNPILFLGILINRDFMICLVFFLIGRCEC